MRIIKCNFYDQSIIIAPTLFYIGILSFCFSENSLNLLLVPLIPISFLYCLLCFLLFLFNIKKVKNLFVKLIILLSPLLLFPSIKIAKYYQNRTVLEGKCEGIISGKNLYLYSNKDFKITEASLLGTNIQKGTYQIRDNEILLNFDSVHPFQLNKLRLKITKNYLKTIDNDLMSSYEIVKNNINSASH